MGEVMGVRLVWFGGPLSEGRQVTAINTGLATGPWKGKSKWCLELSCPGSELGSGVRPRTPPPCLCPWSRPRWPGWGGAVPLAGLSSGSPALVLFMSSHCSVQAKTLCPGAEVKFCG